MKKKEDRSLSLPEQVRAELCGDGEPWETTLEDVLGEQLLVFRNRQRNLEDLFDEFAEKWSGRECLVLGDSRITYDQLPDMVRGASYRLSKKLGIRSGDRVAILAANSPEWVISFFAVTFLGAIAVAINGWWTAAEIDHALQLTKPKVLIGDSRRLMRADNVDSETVIVDIDETPDFLPLSR